LNMTASSLCFSTLEAIQLKLEGKSPNRRGAASLPFRRLRTFVSCLIDLFPEGECFTDVHDCTLKSNLIASASCLPCDVNSFTAFHANSSARTVTFLLGHDAAESSICVFCSLCCRIVTGQYRPRPFAASLELMSLCVKLLMSCRALCHRTGGPDTIPRRALPIASLFRHELRQLPNRIQSGLESARSRTETATCV
jgi:hypothetical protein